MRVFRSVSQETGRKPAKGLADLENDFDSGECPAGWVLRFLPDVPEQRRADDGGKGGGIARPVIPGAERRKQLQQALRLITGAADPQRLRPARTQAGLYAGLVFSLAEKAAFLPRCWYLLPAPFSLLFYIRRWQSWI